ncbi:MAG: EF-P lysine aminoacylase EpmA [Myxococcales bacterium]
MSASTPQAFGHLGESEWWALARDRNQKRERLRARSRVLRWTREFFEARGFLEVETPLVVPSPGLDVHLDAMSVTTRVGERFLITSPEYQMKRLLSGGLERIFQLCKCFRNDELGERHQPEFSMLEWYRAYASVDDVMGDTEQLVATVARKLAGTGAHERAELRTAWGPVDVTPPWPRLTVREALARYAGARMEDVVTDEERFYSLLLERVEPALTELGAVFLTEYPASMASLARKKPEDPSVAERFEAYVAGIELCNGFGELTDAREQRTRLELDQAERVRRGLPVYPIDERFLSALEQGMPPSGGNALGLDRLVMLALGAAHIEDVLAVPGSRL